MTESKGRSQRFEAFFAAESQRLQRFAAWLTGDSNKAADLAQEAFARAYTHWGKIQNEDPTAYTRRIVVNLVRSAHRRRLLETRHRGRGVETVPPVEVEEWLRIADALKGLPPIRRATIVLRFYEDMSVEQIAAALDRPIGSVKSDVHRGIKRLRQLMQQEPEVARDATLEGGESI